jgi:hypothetical protein
MLRREHTNEECEIIIQACEHCERASRVFEGSLTFGESTRTRSGSRRRQRLGQKKEEMKETSVHVRARAQTRERREEKKERETGNCCILPP